VSTGARAEKISDGVMPGTKRVGGAAAWLTGAARGADTTGATGTGPLILARRIMTRGRAAGTSATTGLARGCCGAPSAAPHTFARAPLRVSDSAT
jgi:hypothetical protein